LWDGDAGDLRWVWPGEAGHAGAEIVGPAVVVGVADDEVGFFGEGVRGALRLVEGGITGGVELCDLAILVGFSNVSS